MSPTQKTRLAIAFGLTAAATFTLAAPANASTWDNVAACESGGNWAINTGNGFYGGLQFTHQTWIGYGGGVYANDANGATKDQQIQIAQRVLAGQGPGAWPVCSIKGGLNSSNGGDVSVSRNYSRPAYVAPVYHYQAWVPLGYKHGFQLLAVDGIIGPLTHASMARHGNIRLSSVAAIKAWQRRLQVPVDGIVGPITSVAMQRWLNAR